MGSAVAEVIVYSTVRCPYCQRAKALLDHKGIAYEEVDLTEDDEARLALAEKTGAKTVPQIFIADRHIGGFAELKALDDAGELDALVA